jgi:hypothetical protein
MLLSGIERSVTASASGRDLSGTRTISVVRPAKPARSRRSKRLSRKDPQFNSNSNVLNYEYKKDAPCVVPIVRCCLDGGGD